MDLYKFLLYIWILGICFPIALTYLLIVNIIFGLPVQPTTIVVLAFGYVVMIKFNPVFRELWDQWFRKS